MGTLAHRSTHTIPRYTGGAAGRDVGGREMSGEVGGRERGGMWEGGR